MNRSALFLALLFAASVLSAQPSYRNASTLQIDSIMKGQLFTGYSPERVQWSDDSKTIYFQWNPEMDLQSSWYSTDTKGSRPAAVSAQEEKNLSLYRRATWNRAHDQRVYISNGSLFLENVKKGESRCLLENVGDISGPEFSHFEDAILFTMSENLYELELSSGKIEKLTDIQKTEQKRAGAAAVNEQEDWLKKDQMDLFDVLRSREAEKKAEMMKMRSLRPKPALKPIYTGSSSVFGMQLSPDKRYIFLLLFDRVEGRDTEIPAFVTESGFTEIEKSRSKVGVPYGHIKLKIYDREKDSLYSIKQETIPGIYEIPEYKRTDAVNGEELREINSYLPQWSDDGTACFLQLYAQDNKDRWIMSLKPEDGSLELIDRQHDSAWIDGPGIGGYGPGESGWLPGRKKIWFLSEESGFSHLYTFDLVNREKKALTAGRYEIYDPFLSKDGKNWYFTSNESDPGIRHFYRMNLDGSGKIQLTDREGGNEAFLSPDEKWIAILYSYANIPPELYIQKNAPGQEAQRITHSTTPAFEAYNWRVPEFIRFTASDGAEVPARFYQPEPGNKNGAAVIFVHGAGYLQNAHRWWSDYFREYMFHNFLVDNGYTVLDIDYRGSAGYGRDWRTGIYRYMGGKDLSDQLDGAKFLVEQAGIDEDRIGIYGGSYGGFMTLMAMFTSPGTFACGAALRSVTDWAHYNHGYTSNILNTPVEDSLAYRRSSPIYFADGLSGKLLMCHGMMDDNVHFQDIVRLSQRLIELRKDNWELAVYPLERHSFVEPSSWSDEYRRIYKLFEENLLLE